MHESIILRPPTSSRPAVLAIVLSHRGSYVREFLDGLGAKGPVVEDTRRRYTVPVLSMDNRAVDLRNVSDVFENFVSVYRNFLGQRSGSVFQHSTIPTVCLSVLFRFFYLSPWIENICVPYYMLMR